MSSTCERLTSESDDNKSHPIVNEEEINEYSTENTTINIGQTVVKSLTLCLLEVLFALSRLRAIYGSDF